MPTPTIPDGELFFNATLYAGTSVAQSITNGVAGQSFQPDLVWGKNRTNVNSHRLTDSVRGTGKVLFSDTTNGDTTGDGQLSSFNSNGFSLTGGAGAFEGLNQSGNNYVAWQWKAGGAAVTNTAGTISSQVSANTTSGFSVVTYTGNGSASSQTIGHGLGSGLSMLIVKSRATGSNDNGWGVSHISIASSNFMYLNDTGIAQNWGPGQGQPFIGSGSTFSIVAGCSGTNNFNGSGALYVAYCWTAIAGYSAFGSYTGNGSTDGPFIYTGFRPKFIMVKRTDVANWWQMYDTSRNTYNTADKFLAAQTSDAEYTASSPNDFIDFNSNGFKIRGSNLAVNASGGTYIYMTFAENPFKYANAR